ncbi:MAG: hypothetical protein ACLFQK_05360 [Fibrobacterota bacterium]
MEGLKDNVIFSCAGKNYGNHAEAYRWAEKEIRSRQKGGEIVIEDSDEYENPEARAEMEKGYRLFNDGFYSSAGVHFLIAVRSGFKYGYFMLGNCYGKLFPGTGSESFRMAIGVYSAFIKSREENGGSMHKEAYVNRGMVYYKQGLLKNDRLMINLACRDLNTALRMEQGGEESENMIKII